MSNASNLANLLGTATTVQTAKIADDAITNAKIINRVERKNSLLYLAFIFLLNHKKFFLTFLLF